jgi:hypothetical protein
MTSTTTAVVSCSFVEPVNVILELSPPFAKPGTAIMTAYQEIVRDYNDSHHDNKIQVEIRQTPANNIDNEIATGQPLPNLYVAYGDASAKYETILGQIDEADKIVDMGQAINWNSDYIDSINVEKEPMLEYLKKYRENATKGNELTQGKPLDEITLKDIDSTDPNWDKFHFTPLRDSFPREGSNNQKLYVAPTAKSGMNGIMNTRLINELVKIVSKGTINLATNIPEANIRGDGKFFTDKGAGDWDQVDDQPIKDWTGNWKLPSKNELRDSTKTIAELFQEWFGAITTVKQLQAVMQDLSKLEIIVVAYMKLAGDNDGFQQSFSMAFDDIPGLIYTMQASLGYPEKQIYSWTNESPYKLTFYNNQTNTQALADIIDLFAWADKLRPLDNNAGNTPDHGFGGITAKLNSGKYYSDIWQKQGMLSYFGSTAGAAFWVNEGGVQPQDIQLMSAPSYGGHDNSYVAQQGPGMGMFKSKNQLKNEIAIDFLNYFLRPENNTKFAFGAGYIPSNYYAYYAEKGMSGKPTSEEQMGPYYYELNQEAQHPEVKGKIKAPQVVQKYVDSILENNTQLWTQVPSPFGDAMRFQLLVPWFETNYKTVGVSHNLSLEDFWKNLESESSISNAWRIVHGLFPVEGEYEIIKSEVTNEY